MRGKVPKFTKNHEEHDEFGLKMVNDCFRSVLCGTLVKPSPSFQFNYGKLRWNTHAARVAKITKAAVYVDVLISFAI